MGFLRLRLVLLSLLLLAVMALGGCATVAPPDAGELSEIEAGRKVLLLLRLVPRAGGEMLEPFAQNLAADNMGIGVGSFETGGQVEQVESIRFFSEESRAQGWTWLTAPPGTLYLSFLPPRRTDAFTYARMFKEAPLWRVTPGSGSRIVYAGTMVIDGDATSFTFGGRYLKNYKNMEVRDERDAARALIDRHMPGAGPMETILMQQHKGPIILTTTGN